MSEVDLNDKRLAYQILQFLQAHKRKNESLGGNIDQACEQIGLVFGVDSKSSDDFDSFSYYPTELPEIFSSGVESLGAKVYDERLRSVTENPKFPAFLSTVEKRGYFEGAEVGSMEYKQRHAKVVSKFLSKLETRSVQSSGKADGMSQAQKEQLAEEKKAEGNDALMKKKYDEAVALYSEAISASSNGPSSHIFYSNRAAAYCHLSKYQEAANDCETSVALNPGYVKAHSRLGLSRYFLGQYDLALRAYERAAELEPDNSSHKDSIKQTKQKMEQEKRKSQPAAPAPGAGGMPDLSSLASMMGGSGGIAEMMKNPAMMQMAQQMMQNPAMMQQAMSMMGGGGGGGMPDMSALAAMMGQGGAQGGSSGAPGVPNFSGFAEEENS